MIVVFILSTLEGWLQARGNFLMQGTGCGGNGLALMGNAMLSKSLIQFSADGWGCVPSYSLAWGQTMVGIVAVMVTSFQRTHVSIARLPGLLYSVPRPCSRWLSTHASAGDSWTLTGKSGSLSSGVTAPFSWVLMHTRFCCVLPESVSAVLGKFYNQIPLVFKVRFPGGSPFAWSPGLEICCGP